jgi:tetratricopeptide (TPR) repeat protein
MLLFVALHLVLLQGERAQPDASALKREGLALASERKLTAAVQLLNRACELDPKDEESCYYLGRTLNALGLWEEARAPFEKALRAAPQRMLARVHRAVALNYMAVGLASEAERNFKAAIATRKDAESLAEDPRIDYGAFLFRQGRTDEALQFLREAVRAAPKTARAQAELGRVLLHSGKSGDAVENLEKAVAIDPRSPSIRLLLGRAYLQSGRVEDGQRQLQLASKGLREDTSSVLK